MSEVPAEAAPEVVETASTAEAPVSGESKPEAVVEEKPVEEKRFTQAELDAAIAKRIARLERKRERERPPEPVAEKPQAHGKPAPENFKTTEEYIEAVADWKADQKFTEKFEEREQRQREERAREHQRSLAAEHQKREEVARDKYDDFDDVVYDADLPISQHMALAIQLSEVGPELAYHLGKNPKEAARIAQLHPLAQARELGKLEAKVASAEPPAKPSTAPDPIKPLASKGTAKQIYDTTDPRSTKTMSTSEWIAAERKRQAAKFGAG